MCDDLGTFQRGKRSQGRRPQAWRMAARQDCSLNVEKRVRDELVLTLAVWQR